MYKVFVLYIQYIRMCVTLSFDYKFCHFPRRRRRVNGPFSSISLKYSPNARKETMRTLL
jgi:hypothetical protein